MTWHHDDGRTCHRADDDGLWYIGNGIQCLRAHGSIPSPLESFRPERGDR